MRTATNADEHGTFLQERVNDTPIVVELEAAACRR